MSMTFRIGTYSSAYEAISEAPIEQLVEIALSVCFQKPSECDAVKEQVYERVILALDTDYDKLEVSMTKIVEKREELYCMH